MSGKKITLTIDEAIYTELKKKAQQEGFGRVSTLVRHMALTTMRAGEKSTDCHTIRVLVKNYTDLLTYVDGKSISTIETFAVFAMGQYMAKYPLSEAQKERVKKSIKN